MPLPTLLLGPLLFDAFELPPTITWGGAQALTIHKLPGGTRIIDALGRDDAAITWSGIFTGPDAGLRARGLDLMRANGALWPLTWDRFFYSVVIDRFDAEYRRPNWIPYRISCVILQDVVEAALEAGISLAASALADLTTAQSLTPDTDLTDATTALAADGASTSGTAANSAAQTQLSRAIAATRHTLASTGQALLTSTDLATALPLAAQAASSATAGAYLARAHSNLSQAST